jgi:hypothetical protein
MYSGDHRCVDITISSSYAIPEFSREMEQNCVVCRSSLTEYLRITFKRLDKCYL